VLQGKICLKVKEKKTKQSQGKNKTCRGILKDLDGLVSYSAYMGKKAYIIAFDDGQCLLLVQK